MTNIKQEQKRERFEKVATKRVRAILDKLRLLGNCANTATYNYTEEDTQKIFSAIDSELRRVKKSFFKNNGPRKNFSLK